MSKPTQHHCAGCGETIEQADVRQHLGDGDTGTAALYHERPYPSKTDFPGNIMCGPVKR